MDIIFENKDTTVAKTMDSEETAKYSDFITILVRQPKVEGFTVGEIKDRLDLMKKLDEKSDSSTFTFTDREVKLIKELNKTAKWRILNMDIVEFSEYVESL